MATAFELVPILSLLVAVLVVLLLAVARHYRARVTDLEARVAQMDHARRSQAATYGRLTEQFAPFLPSYPFPPQNFRFIGQPIDGIQFEEDRVVFVEIKANSSRLSADQQRIRRLVEAGRVEWLEFRVEEGREGRGSWGAER